MYRYMFRRKTRFYLFVLLLTATTAASGIWFSVVMPSLVDYVKGGERGVLFTLAGNCLLAAAYMILEILYHSAKSAMIADARYQLKQDIFAGIMGKTPAEFDAVNRAEYVNDLSNTINTYENLYFSNIIRSLECALSFVTAVMISLAVEPLMLILMLMLALATLAATRLTTGPIQRSMKEYTACTGKYMTEIQDDFGGFLLIRSFGILPAILKKCEAKNREMEEAKKKGEISRAICMYAGELTALLSTIIVMAAAAWFAIRGTISAGMILGFGNLISLIVSPLVSLPSVISDFHGAGPLEERFRQLMTVEKEGGTKVLSMPAERIHLEKVTFDYGTQKKILRGLSFVFETGKRYAIVGKSGSGKSTVMALLSGFHPKYGGQIRFDGTELRRIRGDSLAGQIGMVWQDTFLFTDTLRNNIGLYCEEYGEEQIREAICQAGLGPFLEALPNGLDTWVEENGKNLSGGERQRLGLARVLLRGKRILLFDEFTSSLDERTAKEIELNLLSLRECLLITVTHRLNPEILRSYDMILVLEDGRFTAAGTYDELMGADGCLRRMKAE